MPAKEALAKYSVLALCLAVPFTFSRGQTVPSGNTSTKTAPTRPTTPATTEERRPVFLSGRVILDDGTPPEGRVAIERICYGRVRREAYTDLHGAFAFQLGMSGDVFQDASVGGNDSPRGLSPMGSSSYGISSAPSTPTQKSGVSATDLMACELRASLAGFISDTISLAGRQLFDTPNVGTIVLHRTGKTEGTKISVTTLQAPREATKALERARAAAAKDNSAAAIKELEKAVTAYPKFAEALSMLGELYAAKGSVADAVRVLQQSIEADPKFVPPMVQLALLAGQQRDWKRMQELSERALALDPYDYPSAYYFDAVANYNLNNTGAAEKSARTARRLDSQYHIPRIDLLLANILEARQDYLGASEQLQSFLKHQPTGKEADAAREMLAKMETKLTSAPVPGATAPPK